MKTTDFQSTTNLFAAIVNLKKPTIFLDRDGVIIENRANYVRSWQDVEIFPQAIAAIHLLNEAGYKIAVVTNQSAIGRGIISQAGATRINKLLLSYLHKEGCSIDTVQLCPHKPFDHCKCRKPQPGLILQAAHILKSDLSNSFMIGDALTDIIAGRKAGVKESILVQTGRGSEQNALAEANVLRPYHLCKDLLSATHLLLNELQ